MSNRIFGTEKVDDIIGLKERKYDKIDIFSERINPDNLFAILYYTEYINNKEITKQEIVTFPDRQTMYNFVKYNFDTYELTHYVSEDLRKIFFHSVDYCNVDYFLHDGKPDKNYIALNYREYFNDTFYPKTIPFPKEYEKLFLDIVNRSKPKDVNNRLTFANTIDVNEQRRNNIRANYERYTIPVWEFIRLSGEKLRNIKSNRKLIRTLKIIAATALITSILSGGYVLVRDNLFNSEFLEQDNLIRNARDAGIMTSKGSAGVIIEKLMQGKYDEISENDLQSVIDFIDNIEASNYDKNDSFNSFDLDDYFDYLLLGSDNYSESRDMLVKIERLYKNSFKKRDNRVVIDEAYAKEYIDYVASLTFMFDTYHDERKSKNVVINNQANYSNKASAYDMEVYDNFPPILRLIILNQLKGLMAHADYHVTSRPSYYFDNIDKYSLLAKVKDKISEVERELFNKCNTDNKGQRM